MTQEPDIQRLPFGTDAGFGARARLGLVVLQTDQTLETEFRDLTHVPGVSVYHARLPNASNTNADTLHAMERDLPTAAALLPREMNLSAIGYGCTSASTLIGAERVAEILNQAHPHIPATEPMSAGIAALRALGVNRLGLLTPYVPDVTTAMQQTFRAAGFDISVVGSFFEGDDLTVGKIDTASIKAAAIELGTRPDVDGIFISCTSLRAARLIPVIEAALNKPVTASNHALAWHLLRLSGIEDQFRAQGRLFALPLP